MRRKPPTARSAAARRSTFFMPRNRMGGARRRVRGLCPREARRRKMQTRGEMAQARAGDGLRGHRTRSPPPPERARATRADTATRLMARVRGGGRRGARARPTDAPRADREAWSGGSLLYLILGHYSVRQQEMDVRKNGSQIYHNGLIYAYPDGTQDILCATDPIFRAPGWEEDCPINGTDKRKREKGVKSQGADMERSMRRARAKLRRLALANNFQYFVTLTLSPEMIDRYDGSAIVKVLGRWCDNMVRRNGLRYILVPEQHKDGAFHFHGFFAGDGLEVIDSGVKWEDRTVYNLPQWKLGFSAAQELYGDYHAAVGYCCKYIGKQSGERPLGRWYYSGGALREPEKIYADLEYRDVENAVEFDIPCAKVKICNGFGR